MTTEQVRVAGRTPEDLRPVGSQVLDVLGIDAMGERVVQLRILEAALVMRRSKCQEGGVPAGELKHRWAGHSHSHSFVDRGSRVNVMRWLHGRL